MRKKYYLPLILAFIFTTIATGQEKWLIKHPNAFEYYLTTDIQNGKIIGQTRNNALKDIVGSFKFLMAKMATTVKYPEIIHFEGSLSGNTFQGNLQMVFNQTPFQGEIKSDSIVISIPQENGTMTTISGIKVERIKPMRNYKKTFEKIFELTEAHLYHQAFLQTKDWKKFKNKMIALSDKINDDLELQIALAAFARDFPFTHYYIHKTSENTQQAATSDFATLKKIDNHTGMLNIKGFYGTKKEMDSLINLIAQENFKNLIIDLRNNPGGHLEAAFPLAEYLIDQPIVAGVFPNKNWYAAFNRVPTQTDYSKFTEFTGGTLEEWYKKAAENYGAYYKVIPSKRHFTGKVYILTNTHTASTCEPLVFGLQYHRDAIIVGERTAGAMLSAKAFEVEAGVSLMIPLNDYITYSGKRIDKSGIQPDIEIESDQAAAYVLKQLNIRHTED
ncbi:S41 family peptidase [Mesonia sp. K7]|uniref:S41 family peptidase n=1 Tax=Mesonia sp. K7 TaxID=2218606 RepID=UPI000DAA7CAE|nr:S41 family peptidase [Mesonia sp. K7]PZD77114.1 hypothetical protein DNG35_09725 [Mesonia sp. K7]